VIIRFAIANAGVNVTNDVSFDALISIGQFKMIPGTDVSLVVGHEVLRPIYTRSVAAGAGSGEFQSDYKSDQAGMIIKAQTERKVGVVRLTGSIQVSNFEAGGKAVRSYDGILEFKMGKWEPLVMYGGIGAGWPLHVDANGWVVYVRADYDE